MYKMGNFLVKNTLLLKLLAAGVRCVQNLVDKKVTMINMFSPRPLIGNYCYNGTWGWKVFTLAQGLGSIKTNQTFQGFNRQSRTTQLRLTSIQNGHSSVGDGHSSVGDGHSSVG
jgi:hypothetical protein